MRAVEFVREWGGFLFGLCGFLWWLGITPESVGQVAYDVSYWTVPPLLLGCGIWIGWSMKARKMAEDGITAESVRALEEKVAAFEEMYGEERAQITADLTCCDLPGMLLIAQLYCDGFTMAKGDLAEANDPVWLAGIVTTGRVEVDGIVSYRLDLAPERRSLYARHERFFLEEVKRIGKGRVDVDFDGVRVKLHLSAREQ